MGISVLFKADKNKIHLALKSQVNARCSFTVSAGSGEHVEVPSVWGGSVPF